MSHLVTRPRHSIINQAFESKLRFPSARPLNADGFGIGWYDPVLAGQPSLLLAGEEDSTPATPQPTSPQIAATAVADAKVASGQVDPTLRTDTPSPLDAGTGGVSACVNGAVSPVADDDQTEAERVASVRHLRKREREEEDERPCVFKSISPAWSNANLLRLAEKIRSPLIFAHVRASTMSGAPSEDNCHPWVFDRLMWMHNGEINEFPRIKRALQAALPEELFLFPAGYTDAEWAFMVFLSHLRDPHAKHFSHAELRDAMMKTIRTINDLSKEAGITGPSLMNFVVSDGHTVIATRYISSRTSEASSLFFSSGTSFDEYDPGEGMYRMTKADKRERIIMVASEPLTFESKDWIEVKTNTMVVITPNIPIIDEYWVSPQDPAAHHRDPEFAIQSGYGLGFNYNRSAIAA
ncbi:cytoplasm protein [Trichosporon asahii var. asahii CBS 8904]|uniref:Cytoplasm protein n=2 Tax=Trichosporon asahii var. asahii TaxID=189963 RepID=K1VZM2_TRIAC|nr:cytoplasm protein [Trichosporon asahii var. asahii CBS 2479]EJT50003.1 cytoplasm protein [Trichosporon asahii var. asahii CBS 2479]EKD05012.1 cytoplasm protein [Trichosporon asahii var. asahii CBS 8904]